jgi:hypothetical protein
MAEFPWQKPDDDDRAPRFPWQRPDASQTDEDEDASGSGTSLPWARTSRDERAADDAPTPEREAVSESGSSAVPHAAEDPDPSMAPDATADADATAADAQPPSARPASSSMPWQTRQDAADPDSPPASGRETVADPSTWQPASASTGAPTDAPAEPETPASGEAPPSTFTPPWRPEEPRPRTKKDRPTPPDVSTAKPGVAPSRTSGRAGRIAAVSTLGAVAAVILVGVGAALIAPMLGGGRDDGVAAATPTPTVVPVAAGEIGMDATTTFVDAISSGNSALALAMLGRTATALTNDDAWAAMVDAYPITDVEISSLGEDTWESQVYAVSYRMDDELIDFTLTVDVDVADPENVVLDLDMPTLEITDGYEGFDITLNGVALDAPGDASYEIFPGAYTVATTTPYFTIDSSPIIAESSIVFLYPYEHEPMLTEEGVAKFREVVRASAEACVGSTMLDAGCGLDVTGGLEGGGSLVDGTVERTLTDEQWAAIDSMEPEASAFDGAMIQEGDFVGDVAFYADWQQNGASGRDQIHGGPWLYSPHVDFSDPDLPVVWV